MVTLDENRQHGLSRGAFSFVTKPATTEGLELGDRAACSEYATPRRRRLLIVEDNDVERTSIQELLAHDDIDILTAGTGEGRWRSCEQERVDCMVLDLRLPDISGFEVLGRIRDDAGPCRTSRWWSSPAAS